MAKKVAGPRGRGKHKQQDRLSKSERRAREPERRAAWVEQWAAVAKGFIEGWFQAAVDRLLGRPVGQWADRNERVEAGAEGNQGQRKGRGWFRRKGTYPRSLTLDG